MRITLKSIYIFVFLLLPALTYAAKNTDYYVTQNGKGARTGVNLANAWSVSDFNASANWSETDSTKRIDPGDTVYFSGTITSQIVPPKRYGGAPGKYITLDGWEGGTCNPVANLGCDNASVVDLPSRTNSSSNWSIYSIDNSYLIIQDFNLQDSYGGIFASGLRGGSDATHVTVRRNYIHNMEGAGVQMTSMNGSVGIAYLTFGGAPGDGNYVYDTMEMSKTEYTDFHNVGFGDTDDLVVSYNLIDNSFQDQSDASNALAIHYAERFLVEYNTIGHPSGQSCLAKKEQGGDDGIIRFNKFYGCGQQGVGPVTNQGPQTDYYIYGNLIYNSAGGIWCYRNYERIHIWSNVIHNIKPEAGTGQGGWGIDISTGGTAAGGNQGYAYVYNNTVSRGDIDGDTSAPAGIILRNIEDGNIHVKNNIAYYNTYNDKDTQIYIASSSDVLSFNHNTIYSGGTEYVHYKGSKKNVSYMNKAYGLSGNKAADPGFVDPDGADNIHGTADDDYSLDGSNINDGQNLSKCFDVSVQGKKYQMCYGDALDPEKTDWTTTPPTVGTTKQEYHGSWERGAYVYKKKHVSKPSSSNVMAGEYQIVKGLADGIACYVDRSYTYSNVPDFLHGAMYIKTANNDKDNMADPLVKFDVNADATVYVAFDNRAPTPSWLSDFTDTGYDLKTDVPFSIFAKDVPTGSVSLGPNGHNGSMYTVFIVMEGMVGDNQAPLAPKAFSIAN